MEVYCGVVSDSRTRVGGDRRMTFLQVQLAVIAMFFHHNLDELVVARTTAGLSFRNPVERVHAIANLGLQDIGLMREEMNSEMEKIIGKYKSERFVRTTKSSSSHWKKYSSSEVNLLEEVFQRISLKEKPFKLYHLRKIKKSGTLRRS